MSCALVGNLGTCKPIAGGRDGSQGAVQRSEGAASCGTTGFCDGSGGCQLYAAGTQCAPAVVPDRLDHRDAAAHLRRQRHLPAGDDAIVRPYACNGTTCNAACGGDGDCAPGNVCNARLVRQEAPRPAVRRRQRVRQRQLRRRRLLLVGRAAGTASRATSTGMAGMCRPVPAGEMEPHGGCTPNPALRLQRHVRRQRRLPATAPPRTSCGAASCSGSTFTPAGNCDGDRRLRADGTDELRALRLRRGRLPDDLRRRQPTASPASSACRTPART